MVLVRALWLVLLVAGCVERTDAEAPRAPVRVLAVTSSAAFASSAAARSLELSGAASGAGVAGATASLGASPALPLPPAPPPALELEPEIVLAAGGDVNFGRECGQAILKDPTYDPFSGLGAAWTGADARFVNLESQLSDQNGVTQSPGNRLIFSGPPGGADVLARARVSLISTANNHAWDYGKPALLETIANLERVGLPYAGTGRDLEQAYRPAVLRVRGRSIALFAVTQIWNQGVFTLHEGQKHVAWADMTRLKSGIEQARREHDFVLVSYHGGEEYIDAPVDKTRRFVKAVMALGVDAFIGHHPHVPQGVGWVGERPVLYSLGNFVFAGHDDRPWTKHAFFARLVLKKGSAPRLSACPFAIEGHRPRTLEAPRDALTQARFRAHLVGTSTSVGGSSVAEPDELGCLRVAPPLAAGASTKAAQ